MKNTSAQKEISQSRLLYQNPYSYLDDEGAFSAESFFSETNEQSVLAQHKKNLQNPYAFIDDTPTSSIEDTNIQSSNFKMLTEEVFKGIKSDEKLTTQQINTAVNKLKSLIWKHRVFLWDGNCPNNNIDYLDPERILIALGFQVYRHSTLGTFIYKGDVYEVAGEIDRDKNRINLSEQEPHISRNFTLAHELGHALIHSQNGLHRDPPPKDRSNFKREQTEREADKFAALFLMPEKLVRAEFKEIFMVEKFELTQERIYALNPSNNDKYNKIIASRKELALHLARTESYNGEFFMSLSKRFKVSVEAMGFRLLELEIV